MTPLFVAFLVVVAALTPVAAAEVAQQHATGQVPFVKLVPRGNWPQWIKARGGLWQPSSTQVQVMRKALRKYVEHAASAQHVTLEPWKTYTFQYQGKLFHGQKAIFVNAFCTSPEDWPHQEILSVADGGPCFFRVWWSPKRQSFIGLMFNGVA